MGKTKRKKKKPVAAAAAPSGDDVPRSFVVHHGPCGKSVINLEQDLRNVMSPYTATDLKIRKKNVIKDFTSVAGPLGVSHLMVLSKTDIATNLRFVKVPRGPTLTFSITEYSLMRDVAQIVKCPKTIGKQFKNPPLLVMNGFGTDTLPMKLMISMFQNMFPSINVQQVKLKEIKRCVLLSYDTETESIDFRHYHIEAAPVGISRGTKKLIKSRLPNLGSLSDISEFMNGGSYVGQSESEGEEPTDSQVVLPQRMSGKGNYKSGQSAVKLTELGPRMKMQLLKIEEGVNTGEVLYHRYVVKTDRQKEQLRKKIMANKKLKEQRKAEQESNIKRKAHLKKQNRRKSLLGMGKNPDNEESDIEDSEYFRQEIGEAPPEEMLASMTRRKRDDDGGRPRRPRFNSKKSNDDNDKPTSKFSGDRKRKYDDKPRDFKSKTPTNKKRKTFSKR